MSCNTLPDGAEGPGEGCHQRPNRTRVWHSDLGVRRSLARAGCQLGEGPRMARALRTFTGLACLPLPSFALVTHTGPGK